MLLRGDEVEGGDGDSGHQEAPVVFPELARVVEPQSRVVGGPLHGGVVEVDLQHVVGEPVG